MIKRILTCVLAMAMLLTGSFALADEPNAITVGATTRMEGYFFTDLWSANTADNDVRTLLHGYSTVAVDGAGKCILDETAVDDMDTATDDNGSKTYTFTIAPNLKYSDGSALTARDYVFSVLLLASSELRQLGAAPAALEQIVGYGAYAEGKANMFEGVKLIDERRFSLTVDADYLPYFYELMYVNVTPYPMAVLAPGFDVRDDGKGAYMAYVGELAEGEQAPALGDVLAKTILGDGEGYLYFPRVTSGPYMLTAYDRGSGTASFERNRYYAGNFEGQIPNIDALRFVNVTNSNALDMLADGEVDILNKLTDGSVIDDYLNRDMEGFDSVDYPRAGYGFIAFACEDDVTGSVSVRRAIAMLTDADGYVEDFLDEHGQRVYGNYGVGQWMYGQGKDDMANLPQYDLDADSAVKLLDEDGWTLDQAGESYSGEGVRFKRAEDGSLIKLTLNWAALKNNTGCQKLSEYTLDNLRAAGFEVNVTEMNFTEMLSAYYRREARAYNMFYLASNFSAVYDPYYSVSDDAAHQGVQNTTGISDEKLMQLADDMRRTEADNEKAYIAKWVEFQQRYAELLPTYPLYSNEYCDVYDDGISNYRPDLYSSWAMAILYAEK